MQKILTLLTILAWATIASATGIVDNGAGVAEDSLSIPIYSLDSIGTPQAIAAGDSVYVVTFYANGAEAFRDSMAGNDASITTSAWEDFAGVGFSNYKEGVDLLDGTANEGVYSYVIVVDDVSLGLETIITGSFQLYDTKTLSEILDEVEDVLDTLQNQDNWIATAANLTLTIDSVNAILDTLQNQDDWVATAAALTNAIDSINAILDSLQLHDNWVAQEATDVTLADGEFAIVADSIWQADTTTHNAVAGSFGEFLYKPQSASLTDADMAAIADSVWQADTAGHNAVAASFGQVFSESLDVAANVASMDAGVIGVGDFATGAITGDAWAASATDEIWEVDTSTFSAAQGVGEMLKDTLAYQGGAASVTLAGIADTVWQHKIRADTTDGAVDDTTAADHLYSASVGGGASNWSDAQRDSVLRNMEDRALALAKFDTASVAAYYGFVIWLDDGAANTNTTVGVDGTLANPVSTLAAARILADSMDIHQYNILNASSFTLAATHENWVFNDVGHNGTIDLGSQDVDNSTFIGLDITGTQGGTGTISLFDCDITDLHDFDGEALFCWLVDSLVMDNNSDAFFGNCYSSVAGNASPKIDFHVASNNIAFRNYSGGINIVNMSSNDKLSIEGNGQVIVDATCSNAPITARGNFTITDNGSGTVWSRQAVFNWRDISDADYNFGIWIDDGAANTNTTAGVDGTRVNPVSTLAAARTLADAIGFQKYYFINNSNLTLAATHEDWEFIGIGRGNLINFGSQDVDNSDFYNLMITGTQGGSGVVLLDLCYLNTPDSLEALVTRSSLSDTISLRVSTATVFDQCYSNIAGNNTPGLDFNSAAGTIEVGIRHYSGGITLLNGASTHTISYESIGQLIIDASCTSINVTGRGIMDLTNNGTTTNLTDNAVVNITAIAEYTQYTVKAVVEDSSGNTTLMFQTDLGGTGINDLYNRQQIEYVSGDRAGYVTQISDYVAATGVITVSPGIVGGPDAGDTVKITGSLIGLMANNPDSNLVNVSSTANVYADSVLRPPQTMVAEDTVTTGDTLAVKKDSLIYQGAGSSAEGIKNAVWGQVADSAFAAGSMGDSAKGWGATGAAPGGSGAFSCSLFAYNSGWIPNGGSPAITSGKIRMISGVNDYILSIDANGWAVFSLDGGTWTAYITALRFLQDTIPQTFTFSADYVDTLTMTAFTPTAPSGDLTTLYNWIVDGNDQGIKNVVVEAYIPNKFWPVKNTNKAVRAQHSTKTDSVGYWELQIFGNDIILTDQGDSSSYWMVTTEDETFKHKVTVSSDSSTQLMIKDSD